MPTATLNGATRHNDNVAMSQTATPPSDMDVANSDTTSDIPSDTATTTWRQKLRQRRDMMTQLVADNDSRLATIALHTGLAIVVVVNFVLSFAGIYDYARHSMGYNLALSPLAPIGIDGLTLCAIAGVYRMRNAHWRIRLFTWIVYLVPTAISVAMNVGHATQRHNDTAAVASAATWPILLSLAIHLSVVVSRQSERAKHVAKKKRQRQPGTDTSDIPVAATTTVAHEATPKPATTTQTPKRQETTAPATTTNDKLVVRQRVANGDDISDILSDMKLASDKSARRRFERWTQDIRSNQ